MKRTRAGRGVDCLIGVLGYFMYHCKMLKMEIYVHKSSLTQLQSCELLRVGGGGGEVQSGTWSIYVMQMENKSTHKNAFSGTKALHLNGK